MLGPLATLGALLLTGPTPEPPVWRYDAHYRAGTLAVTATFPAGSGRGLTLDTRVEGVDLATIDCRRGCRVAYRIRLEGAQSRDLERRGRVWITRPRAWLARPSRNADFARFDLGLEAAPGSAAVAGYRRVGDRIQGRARAISRLPLVAFGPLEHEVLDVDGVPVQLAVEAKGMRSPPGAVRGWVLDNTRAVGRYYGGFPTPHALVLAVPVGGSGVPFGTAQGYTGAAVKIYVGRDAGAEDLYEDWKLRHELAHLGLPNLAAELRWMEEGLATYVETVLAAKMGKTSQAELWRELADGFERGLPRGRPFDDTSSWGATYWGGALFWFLADVRLRVATGGRATLQSALQNIGRRGGTMWTWWSKDELIAALDHGLPRPVVGPLREAFGARGEPVDLDGVLAKLGVKRDRFGRVTLDPKAPWAAYRRAIAAEWETSGATRSRTR